VRSKLKQFPEITQVEFNLKKSKVYLQAVPEFEQYVALEHALEDSGGAIHMFHPRYLVPRAFYATLGIRDRDPDKLDRLRQKLGAVPGVRTAVIDPDRWFTNEKGLDVGGVVVFAERTPLLEIQMTEAARQAGFIFEPKDHEHDPADDSKEWSETNHGFAGLCLLFLGAIGMLNVGLARPPSFVKYGSVFIWLALFVFLFIRADRPYWPLGRASWWDGFREWDATGHRIGMLVMLLIALGDFTRLRKGWKIPPAIGRWGLLAVGLAGSAMLFTHLHTTLDPAHYPMVRRMNSQHLAMATCALGFTLSKFSWDTWQWPKKWGQYVWLSCLLVLGIILNMYVE